MKEQRCKVDLDLVVFMCMFVVSVALFIASFFKW